MLHSGTDKSKDEAELELMLTELKGLLHITKRAFGLEWETAQPSHALDLIHADESPEKVAELQLDLQQTVLEKLNHLEKKLLQLKANRYQDSHQTPSTRTSLFDPL